MLWPDPWKPLSLEKGGKSLLFDPKSWRRSKAVQSNATLLKLILNSSAHFIQRMLCRVDGKLTVTLQLVRIL
jgi:hypothetical protein